MGDEEITGATRLAGDFGRKRSGWASNYGEVSVLLTKIKADDFVQGLFSPLRKRKSAQLECLVHCLPHKLLFGGKMAAKRSLCQAGGLHEAGDTDSVHAVARELPGGRPQNLLPGFLLVIFQVS